MRHREYTAGAGQLTGDANDFVAGELFREAALMTYKEERQWELHDAHT